MKEIIVSTIEDLFLFINESSDKNLYFRGEHKDYREYSCLPPILRKNAYKSIGLLGDVGVNWFTEKLEYLGIKTPHWPCRGNSEGAIITNAFVNLSPWSWHLWKEDKLQALMKHYAFDFIKLESFNKMSDSRFPVASFPSSFLDITSDIMAALHFACSKFCFHQQKDETDFRMETTEDGYLFIFDLTEI